jgi:hypothetical protein
LRPGKLVGEVVKNMHFFGHVAAVALNPSLARILAAALNLPSKASAY